MIEKLETLVKKSTRGQGNVSMVLSTKGIACINFQLPLSLNVNPGDKIDFYDSLISVVGGCGSKIKSKNVIWHSNYEYGVLSSKNGKEILSFDSRDMRILTEIRAYPR